jgi:hypothetical protein
MSLDVAAYKAKYPKLLPLIRRSCSRLYRLLRYERVEDEEIEQSAWLAVCLKSPRFDSTRGKETTFVTVVVRSCLQDMVTKVTAEQRTHDLSDNRTNWSTWYMHSNLGTKKCRDLVVWDSGARVVDARIDIQNALSRVKFTAKERVGFNRYFGLNGYPSASLRVIAKDVGKSKEALRKSILKVIAKVAHHMGVQPNELAFSHDQEERHEKKAVCCLSGAKTVVAPARQD